MNAAISDYHGNPLPLPVRPFPGRIWLRSSLVRRGEWDTNNRSGYCNRRTHRTICVRRVFHGCAAERICCTWLNSWTWMKGHSISQRFTALLLSSSMEPTRQYTRIQGSLPALSYQIAAILKILFLRRSVQLAWINQMAVTAFTGELSSSCCVRHMRFHLEPTV